jgi:hypothetical protein
MAGSVLNAGCSNQTNDLHRLRTMASGRVAGMILQHLFQNIGGLLTVFRFFRSEKAKMMTYAACSNSPFQILIQKLEITITLIQTAPDVMERRVRVFLNQLP